MTGTDKAREARELLADRLFALIEFHRDDLSPGAVKDLQQFGDDLRAPSDGRDTVDGRVPSDPACEASPSASQEAVFAESHPIAQETCAMCGRRRFEHGGTWCYPFIPEVSAL